MSTRVYVPSSPGRLRELAVAGGIGPVPIPAHAVTAVVRTELADAGEEEQEYAVLTAAAQDSLGLLADEDPPRRVVVVAEAETVTEAGEGSLVDVEEVLSLRRVVAVHVDSDDAAADVSAARTAWESARSGDAEAQRLVDRCEDHELGWFATQEIGSLVELG